MDPMLATGGSADYAVREITKFKPKMLSFCGLVAAPEGVKRLNEIDKDLDIYTIALDSHLNKQKFIVPSAGDFGDRYHGTTSE
jgi:uracil phosphoribosyltransferase